MNKNINDIINRWNQLGERNLLLDAKGNIQIGTWNEEKCQPVGEYYPAFPLSAQDQDSERAMIWSLYRDAKSDIQFLIDEISRINKSK